LKLTEEKGFFKQALTILTGAAIAQFIPILTAPIISRLFSPADFGAFGVYLALATITSTAATLRYSHAILLPEPDEDAVALSLLCLWLSAAVAGAATLIFVPFASEWELLFKIGFKNWAWSVPICVGLLGAQTTLYTLSNRYGLYRTMAASRFSTAVGMLLAIGCALLVKPYSTALIWSNVCGQAFSVFALVAGLYWSRSLSSLEPPKWDQMFRVAKRYRYFAFYSLPADAISSVSSQLPPLLIGKFFSNDTVGLFNMTTRIMVTPLSLFSSAVLDVFKQRAAREYASGSCKPLFLKTFKALLLIGIPFFIIVAPFAPSIFSFVLGSRWKECGEIAQILTPLLLVRFIVSPLSYIVYIAEKQIYDLIWQAGLLIVVFSSFTLGGLASDFRLSLVCYTCGGVVMYAIYLHMNWRFSSK
jgi:O-antigen/teichoic acid export membrane protein